jgi:peptide/nickel transport system permease protein
MSLAMLTPTPESDLEVTSETPPEIRRPRSYRRLGFLPAGIVVVIAIIGPWIVPHNPTMVVGSPSQAPNGTFWFGTDSSGLDVFSRVLAATRVDVEIATLVTVFSAVLGILIGLLVGMNESRNGPLGILARGLARMLDLTQAIPAVVIGLVIVAFYGASVKTLILAITIIVTPIQSRLVRTEVLKVRSEAYLDASRMAGLGEFQLTMRNVLPNSSWPVMENASVIFGVAIILTAALGFLGVGLPPPKPEWGSMISQGASNAEVGRWWSFAFPAIALVFTVASAAVATATVVKPKH